MFKIIVLFAVLAGAGIAVLMKPSPSHVKYHTEKITRGGIRQAVSVDGTLNPVQVVEVGTQTTGKITKLYVKQNDMVKKGELLAEIDPALLISQLKQSTSSMETAKLALDQAERNLRRTRSLVEKDYVAQVDLENAEQSYRGARNGYDAAKAQVEKDRINLDYAKIYSPIDGIVMEQVVTEGQTMTAGYQTPTLFRIAKDLSKMKIDVSIPESDVGRVKKGMPVVFSVDAFPDREFKGVVLSVNLSPESQQGVVTYKVTVAVDNPDHVLVPGMTTYVSVILAQKNNVLRIPAAAFRFQPPKENPAEDQNSLEHLFGISAGRNSSAMGTPPVSEGAALVYLLKNDELKPVAVKKGMSDDNYTEVQEAGIAEGDQVVTSASYESQ